MAELLVGHGPLQTPHLNPYVPDFLIVQDEQGRKHVLSRQGRLNVPFAAFTASRRTGSCAPQPTQPGMWPMVHSNDPSGSAFAIEWFSLETEVRWRTDKARAIFDAVKGTRGQPEKIVEASRAAAALVSVNLDKVVRDLQGAARPGEGLAEAYERTKKPK